MSLLQEKQKKQTNEKTKKHKESINVWNECIVTPKQQSPFTYSIKWWKTYLYRHSNIKRSLLPPSPDPEPASEKRAEWNYIHMWQYVCKFIRQHCSVKCITVYLMFDVIPE